MLDGLQQYLRDAAARGRTTTRVGPFLVTIEPESSHPMLNYAVPDDGAAPDRAQVEALAAAMEARDRVPRLEYLEPTAPALLPALEAAGFRVELRPVAMVASSAAAVPVPDGYAVVLPASDADRRAMLAVQNVAYGGAADVDAAQLARSRALDADGGVVVAVAAADGAIVAGGAATPPAGSGFTEVAGIAVAVEHRRRGVATALTAELTRRALAADVETAYLTPADDGAQRVYARAGFRTVGHVLHVRRE